MLANVTFCVSAVEKTVPLKSMYVSKSTRVYQRCLFPVIENSNVCLIKKKSAITVQQISECCDMK